MVHSIRCVCFNLSYLGISIGCSQDSRILVWHRRDTLPESRWFRVVYPHLPRICKERAKINQIVFYFNCIFDKRRMSIINNLLDCFLRGHMTTRIERIRRWTTIDVKGRFAAHAQCNHRADTQTHRATTFAGFILSPIVIACWNDCVSMRKRTKEEIRIIAIGKLGQSQIQSAVACIPCTWPHFK